MSKRLNSTGVVSSFFEMHWFYNSTPLKRTKIPAYGHVSNSCDLVAVNNTKKDVTGLLCDDWLEFMQLGHITDITVCASCEEVVGSCRLF